MASLERHGALKRLAPVVGLAVCVLIPSAVFLGRYLGGDAPVAPAGSDTPQHVWRSEVVAELGLDALPPFSGEAQALNTNADRPGLPLLLAVLSSVTGSDAKELSYILPAVAAVAIAMAAAALAGTIPGVPWWGIAVVGVATGASVQVAFAANGYLDQLVVEPLLLVAAAGALRAAGGGPGRELGAACLLAAWLVHWQFALVFTALLVLLAIACLPASIGERREGRSLSATASAKVGATVAGGAGLGLVALLVGTAGPLRLPSGLGHGSVERDLGAQLDLYRLPANAPAAALGAVSLAARRDPAARRAAWLLVPWALIPAAAAVSYATGALVPVQRSLSFALAIPLLGALGAVAAVGWLRKRLGAVAGVAGAILLAAALVASVTFGWSAWRTREPWSEDRRLAEFHALGAYLVDAGRPAVIVVDRPGHPFGAADEHFGTVPVMRRIRAELPARLALQTTVYLGDPDMLRRRTPTLRPGTPGFDRISRETWRTVRPLLRRNPVIVVLRSQFINFQEAVLGHPDWIGFPWVAIVSGPTPPASFARPQTPEPPTAGSLVARWAASLAVIVFAGIGWAGRLAGGPVMLRIAAAPATGIAMLVIAGLVAEHLGIRTGHVGGVAIVIAVSFAGAVAAATRKPGETSDMAEIAGR